MFSVYELYRGAVPPAPHCRGPGRGARGPGPGPAARTQNTFAHRHMLSLSSRMNLNMRDMQGCKGLQGSVGVLYVS